MANNTLAYGFTQYRHLAAQRVSQVGERGVFSMIQASAAEHTRMLAAVLGGLVQRTTDHKIRFHLPGSGTLQPITEDGSPLPTRPTGSYDVAFPIQGGGDAWGSNRVSRALMTVDEANRRTLDAMRRDADWIYRHVMAAIFDNVAWTYTDPLYGSLTVEPLANGDVTFTKVGGGTEAAQHYLAQANSIDDSNNPFDDIYDQLMEFPSNSGPVVVYVPTNLTASIEALTNFTEIIDPDIRPGMASDVIGASAAQIAAVRGPGDEVLGKCDKCWIVEWRRLPDNYMFAHATGAGPVLGMREYPDASLQGFFAENDAGDGNLQQTKMIRFAGFGVQNRLAGLAYRVGNGSYAIPSGYGAPLEV